MTAGAQPVAPAADAVVAQRAAASHVLVAYRGAHMARSNVHRTRDEARLLAEEVLEKARNGADFADLARRYSDDPTGARGGFLGGFDPGAMVEPFEKATFALPMGGISDVVETEFGFHVIRREPLDEAHVAQVLIQWKDIPGAKARRTRAEAHARAEEALARLAGGEAFDEVARSLSDGATAPRGGDLGWFTRGQFLPDFEDAVFALRPGETSGIVETKAGFHVIHRME